DGDGIGDACDMNNDQDNDGIDDGVDNCPTIFNPEQGDVDNDGIGDVCDDDADGDGIDNNNDNCVYTPNNDQVDTDTDGIGDACEDDRDGDTILDPNDNCLNTPNTDQADQDLDGIGDVCDDDRDGDGIPNDTDNCPFTANADQADSDGNGIGDVCDGGGGDPTDTDGDGIPDVNDNCPMIPNADQADADGDGKGDVCDDDGFTCSAATTYQPLTNADFTANGGVLGVCLGCSVDSPELSIDNNNSTFAQINIGAALVYGGGFVAAVANDTSVDIADSVVGFVVSDPTSQLVNLELLGNFTTIRFFNDGVEVDSATVGGGLLDLDLLGLGANSDQRFIAAPASSQAFDSIQLDYAGLVNANKSFRVHDVCVGTP
ncbi:thrombospondin, partial [Alcanivorax sp. HI0013]